MKKIYIRLDSLKFEIILRNTITANIIKKNLPLKGEAQKWGQEYYFYTKLKIPAEETAKQIINFGEIAYWANGNAIAIGYGKTPLSIKNEIRLADKCNIWADTKFDLNKLEKLIKPKKIYVESV